MFQEAGTRKRRKMWKNNKKKIKQGEEMTRRCKSQKEKGNGIRSRRKSKRMVKE